MPDAGEPDPRPTVALRRLGRVAYDAGRRMQEDLVAARARDEVSDLLLLLEHDPVVTIGRGGAPADAGAAPFPVVEVERGGEATYHGPGQLVGYPILLLREGERDLHRHLRRIEDLLILALDDLGVAASRNPPHTGVWIGGSKVASIGVAVRRWVTWHGFALNVAVDLEAFGGFRPCGLDASVMTSLHRHVDPAPDLDAVGAAIWRRFPEVFARRA